MQNRQQTGWASDVQRRSTVKDLWKGEGKFDDFIPLLKFRSEQEATDFAECISLFRKHKLPDWEQKFIRIAKARMAVNADRAKLVAQTEMELAVPEFFGGKAIQSPKKERIEAQRNGHESPSDV